MLFFDIIEAAHESARAIDNLRCRKVLAIRMSELPRNDYITYIARPRSLCVSCFLASNPNRWALVSNVFV